MMASMLAAIALAATAQIVEAPDRMGPHQVDPRCAYTSLDQIPRDDKGRIKRSMTARAEFMRMHRCPSTSGVAATCPGWAVDHVIPLAVGGADAPINMQWLPAGIKSCASREQECKDRFERKIYRCAP
jgi:hypothetical protein